MLFPQPCLRATVSESGRGVANLGDGSAQRLWNLGCYLKGATHREAGYRLRSASADPRGLPVAFPAPANSTITPRRWFGLVGLVWEATLSQRPLEALNAGGIRREGSGGGRMALASPISSAPCPLSPCEPTRRIPLGLVLGKPRGPAFASLFPGAPVWHHRKQEALRGVTGRPRRIPGLPGSVPAWSRRLSKLPGNPHTRHRAGDGRGSIPADEGSYHK